MKYCFYETTNLVNGKKYLGIHGSEDFEKDDYIGSGTLLQEAIQKYGRDKFIRKDIRYFNSQDEARKFEALSITPEILRSSNYYNIAKGGGGGSAGSKPFYEGEVRYLVDPEAVGKFREQHPGAVEGVPEKVGKKHSVRMTGRITINNGVEHKLVTQERLSEYLEKGWKVGTTPELNRKNSDSKKGIKIMHLGDKTRHVKLQDVEKFLQEGYSFGPSKWLSKLNGQLHRGLVKIHRDGKSRFVSKDKLKSYLEQGFQRGTSPQEIANRKAKSVPKIRIFRGSQEKRVCVRDVERYVKEGWSRGRAEQTNLKLSEKNRQNSEVRMQRSREEAATRRLIYTKSEDFQEWWKVNCKNYARVHYSVSHFLRELGLSKSEFLNKMREKGEI